MTSKVNSQEQLPEYSLYKNSQGIALHLQLLFGDLPFNCLIIHLKCAILIFYSATIQKETNGRA